MGGYAGYLYRVSMVAPWQMPAALITIHEPIITFQPAMKNAIPILFLAVASGSVVLAQEVAFVNVTVLPMDSERVLEGHTVLIRGDRIVAVGPSDEIQPSNGAVSIDGTGKFLIPGLAEMHGHVPRPDEQAQHMEDVLFLYLVLARKSRLFGEMRFGGLLFGG